MMFYGTKGNQNYNLFPAVTFKMFTLNSCDFHAEISIKKVKIAQRSDFYIITYVTPLHHYVHIIIYEGQSNLQSYIKQC